MEELLGSVRGEIRYKICWIGFGYAIGHVGNGNKNRPPTTDTCFYAMEATHTHAFFFHLVFFIDKVTFVDR
jgi:hypothetical protein